MDLKSDHLPFARGVLKGLVNLFSEIIRMWPVWIIMLIGLLLFSPSLHVGAFWRIYVGAVGFFTAHLFWKAIFGYLDLKAMIESADNSLEDSIIVLGVCILRAAVYFGLIFGCMMNMGGP